MFGFIVKLLRVQGGGCERVIWFGILEEKKKKKKKTEIVFVVGKLSLLLSL